MLLRCYTLGVLAVFLCLSIYADMGTRTNTSVKQPASANSVITQFVHEGSLIDNSLTRTIGLSVLLVFLGLVLFWLRQGQSSEGRIVDSIDETRALFLKTKEKTIVKNLRSGDENLYVMALMDITHLPFSSEAVTRELSLAVGTHGEYRKYKFLDSELRCKSTRFLHLMLERSRSLRGKKPWPKASFDSIYYDCSFCNGLYARKKFWKKCMEMLTENISNLIKK